jgi:hypothetical protein
MAKDVSPERSEERAEIQESLGSRIEGLLQQMQTPAAKRATEAAFNASPDELGRAAVAGPTLPSVRRGCGAPGWPELSSSNALSRLPGS